MRSSISIHSPQVRRDWLLLSAGRCCSHFNPLSSSEERHWPDVPRWRDINFNPLSSSEERPGLESAQAGLPDFNPLSSSEERQFAHRSPAAGGQFQSTLHISDTYGHCFRKHPDSDFGIIRTLISAHPDTLSKD